MTSDPAIRAHRRRVWIPAIAAASAPAGEVSRPTPRVHVVVIHAGANPLEVAAKLRHARVMTTLATYGHLFPGTNDGLDALLAETYEGASGPRASVNLSAAAPARAVHTAPAGIS